MKNMKELKKDIIILVMLALCMILGASLWYQHEVNESIIGLKESVLMRNVDYLEHLQQKDILLPEYSKVIEAK